MASQALTCRTTARYVRTWAARLDWRLWLIGPGAMLLLAGLGSAGLAWPATRRAITGWGQTYADAAGPFVLVAAACVYVVRAARTRNPLCVILLGLAAALLLREIHFGWTDHGIYVLLGVVGVWAALWWKRIELPLRDFRHTSWLLATLWTYFLAFLVSRRAFQFVPGEAVVHSFLEECLEVVSHAMLIVTSLAGSWRRIRRPAGK